MPDEPGRAPPAASHTQGDRRRIIYPPAIGTLGTPAYVTRPALFEQLGPDCVMMMGDNPALPRLPEKPNLLDFFHGCLINLLLGVEAGAHGPLVHEVQERSGFHQANGFRVR